MLKYSMAAEEIWETPSNIIKNLKGQELSHEKERIEEQGLRVSKVFLTEDLETC